VLELEAGQQALEEAFGGCGVPPLLDEDVEHDTVLVHGAPEVEELTVDLQSGLARVLTDPTRAGRSASTPSTHATQCLNTDAACRQRLLDHA
jgi:hypothetical protein